MLYVIVNREPNGRKGSRPSGGKAVPVDQRDATQDTGVGEEAEAEAQEGCDLALWCRRGWQVIALGPDPTPRLIIYGPPAQHSFIGEHW